MEILLSWSMDFYVGFSIVGYVAMWWGKVQSSKFKGWVVFGNR